jgi:hypothetical protein
MSKVRQDDRLGDDQHRSPLPSGREMEPPPGPDPTHKYDHGQPSGEVIGGLLQPALGRSLQRIPRAHAFHKPVPLRTKHPLTCGVAATSRTVCRKTSPVTGPYAAQCFAHPWLGEVPTFRWRLAYRNITEALPSRACRSLKTTNLNLLGRPPKAAADPRYATSPPEVKTRQVEAWLNSSSYPQTGAPG